MTLAKQTLRQFIILLFVLLGLSSFCAASTNISGTIITDTTWDVAGSPYVITANITVNSGVTLTIEPGTVVKFAFSNTTPRYRMLVNGVLDAQGTAGSPIYITSLYDDTPETNGDTGGDGAVAPFTSAWGHVYFNGAGSNSSILDHVEFRWGGYYDGGNQYMVRTVNSAPLITNCVFRDVYNQAVWFDRPLQDITFTGNHIENATLGLNIDATVAGPTSINVSNNTFVSNSRTGRKRNNRVIY